MLSLTIFLPLLVGLVVLAIPAAKASAIRWTALGGAAGTFIAATVLLVGFDFGAGGLQWRTTLPWIPPINASYDVAVDGVSLPLILLTAVLLMCVMGYVLRDHDRPKGHAFLFLLMATGLMGVFASQDLLLFYLFFEIALVPLYFIISLWGHAQRQYAAMKFFLYTRAGSLAMLLSFLGLYLSVEPHTFSLPTIIETQPLAGRVVVGNLVLLGMLIGFGVKLPTVPLHNWLPDAHVEAPTEGSVILAALLLKLGAYGVIRILLPTVPEAAERWAWVLIVLGLVSLVYGALAALGQRDLKRLIAYTSINHMGYILLAAGAWALTEAPGIRALAVIGATYQMISHGLLTGAMFFVVGILQDQAGTRAMSAFGGLWSKTPILATLTAVLALGSFGLPGLSGFIAEFQVIGATVSVSLWAAAVIVLALVITTGLYLRVVVSVLMGDVPVTSEAVHEPAWPKLLIVGALAGLSLLLGILPALLTAIITGTAETMAASSG